MKVIKMDNLTLFDLAFFSATKADLLADLDERLHHKARAGSEPPLIIFTPNPEQVVITRQRAAFKSMLQRGDYLLPDGGGVVLASRIFNIVGKLRGQSRGRLTERIAGNEFVRSLLEKYKDEPVLLVGGRGYQFSKAAKNKTLPDTMSLSIQNREVAWFTGYQSVGFASSEDEQKVRLVLRKLKPTIVFVAFGAPEQEEWIINHLGVLQQEGIKIVMAVGGSFDVLTGKLKRAPNVWQKLGFEWLFRLIQEPTRWRRQLRLISFMGLTFSESWLILIGRKKP